MKFSLQRLLTIAAGITASACLVAFIVRHAKHGFALYLGDVAWFTFVIGVLITALLLLATLAKLALKRRSTRPVAR